MVAVSRHIISIIEANDFDKNVYKIVLYHKFLLHFYIKPILHDYLHHWFRYRILLVVAFKIVGYVYVYPYKALQSVKPPQTRDKNKYI